MASGSLREPLLAPDTLAGIHERSAGPTNAAPCEHGPCCGDARFPPSPPKLLGSSNWLSSLTFAWVAQLLRRGSTQPQLPQEDLLDLPRELQPAACGELLWRRWLAVGACGLEPQ